MLLAPDFDSYGSRGESSIYLGSWQLSGLMAVCHEFIFMHGLKTAPKSFALCKSCLSLIAYLENGITKNIMHKNETLCTAMGYTKFIWLQWIKKCYYINY